MTSEVLNYPLLPLELILLLLLPKYGIMPYHPFQY